MLNIQINGEKVIIFEQTNLNNLHGADAYAMDLGNGCVSIRIPKDQSDGYFTDLFMECEDITNLYIAGIVTADKVGNIETVTNNIVFDKLTWDNDAWEYVGIIVENANFEELNSKAGIKVFFGEH